MLNVLLPDSEKTSSPRGQFLSQFSGNEQIGFPDPSVCSAGGRQVSFGSAAGSSYFFFLAKSLYACFCGPQNVRFRHGVLRPLIRLTSGRLVGH